MHSVVLLSSYTAHVLVGASGLLTMGHRDDACSTHSPVLARTPNQSALGCAAFHSGSTATWAQPASHHQFQALLPCTSLRPLPDSAVLDSVNCLDSIVLSLTQLFGGTLKISVSLCAVSLRACP